MRRALLALAAVAVFLALLLAMAPAALLPRWLPATLGLELHGVTGSLWHGRAAIAAIRTPSGHFRLGAVLWRLEPWSLLTLRPSVEVSAHWGQQRLEGHFRRTGEGGFLAREVTFELPAAALRTVLPVQLGGLFEGELEQLRLFPGAPSVLLRGQLRWEDASWRAGDSIERLGRYQLDAEPEEGATVLTLRTLEGPVQASGAGRLSDDGSYLVDLELRAEGGLSPSLAEALALVASPTENGYGVRLQGDWQ